MTGDERRPIRTRIRRKDDRRGWAYPNIEVVVEECICMDPKGEVGENCRTCNLPILDDCAPSDTGREREHK